MQHYSAFAVLYVKPNKTAYTKSGQEFEKPISSTNS